MKKTVKLLLILTVILMCLSLTACGKSTKAELAPYLSVSYTGYNGNGTAHVDFDFADFEGKMYEIDNDLYCPELAQILKDRIYEIKKEQE